MHAIPADGTSSPLGQRARVQPSSATGTRARLRRGRRNLPHLAVQVEVEEQVVGPVNGYFIALAVWASIQHPGEFVAYYKLSADRPRGYWDIVGEAKGCVPEVLPDSATALAAAEELGALHARNLAAPTI